MHSRRDWHVLAPDWRGFGWSEWCADGYWFADYLADLDALLDHFVGDVPVPLVGHSLGGNVVMLYAGVRPQRVSRVVSLDGFGIPPEPPTARPPSTRKWLDALAATAIVPRRTPISRRSPINCRRTIRA